MAFRDEHTFLPLSWLFVLSILAWLLSGCAAVKNPPKGQPFVFENKVVVRANGLSAENRKDLEDRMLDYLDDSLRVRSRMVLGRSQRVNPPVFDSANIARSIRFMNGYLNSIGYYNASFDTFTVRIEERAELNQERVFTTFYVTLGKAMRVDTLIYSFTNPVMQHIADSVKPSSDLNRDALYSKDRVAAELDRLSAIFRNRGFMRIGRAALLAEGDTTDPSLISFDADPIEQLLSAQRRREDPRIKLTIFQRPGVDSSVFLQYYIDTVTIYPETRVSDEVDKLIRDSTLDVYEPRDRILLKYRDHLFTNSVVRRQNYLLPGRMYDEAWYFRTINSYSQAGPWEQVDVRTFTRVDSIPQASFHIFLYPAKKQSFQVDLEASQNNNISVSNVLAGRFLALSLNATHRNRNVFRRGTQATTSARFGLEFNNTRSVASPNFFQTFIVSLNQSYSLPRLLWPLKFMDTRRKIDAGRTNINFGALYTDRFRFFTQTALNANLQWEWRKGRNTHTLAVPNLESVFTQATDSLIKVVQANPALLFAFTPGNILSVRHAFERAMVYRRSPKHTGLFRISNEITIPGNMRLWGEEFFKFYRVEGQYVHNYKMRKSSLHGRLYAGVGWDISDKPNATLPFFRQFVAGGNNSMRAWQLRLLGLGHSIVSDTASFPDRFGDIQLEMNLEHRYRLFRFLGFVMEGATFADIGNIWNHKNNLDGEGKLMWRNLYRDVAVALGTGLRWDMSYLVIRFDLGFKLKDPVREGNGWIRQFEWKSSNRLGGPERSNLSLQFGIGYPF